MGILFKKVRKAQTGLKVKRYAFSPLPSVDLPNVGKKYMNEQFAGAVGRDNKSTFMAEFNADVNKGEALGKSLQALSPDATGILGIQGEGSVLIGVPGNDTLIDLNDQKIHRLKYNSLIKNSSLPMKFTGPDGSKAKVQGVLNFIVNKK